jgi:hypothetical protein
MLAASLGCLIGWSLMLEREGEKDAEKLAKSG